MEPPFSLQHIDHVVLRTSDGPRLVSFYECLGCALTRHVEHVGLWQLRAGTSIIDIITAPDENRERNPNLDHFALRITPFDESVILAWCKKNDIPAQAVEGELFGADGYGPAVYIEDPEGNRVELKGPPTRSADVAASEKL